MISDQLIEQLTAARVKLQQAHDEYAAWIKRDWIIARQ